MPKRSAPHTLPAPLEAESDAIAGMLASRAWPGFAAHHDALEAIAVRSGIKKWSSGLRIEPHNGVWTATPERQWWSDPVGGTRQGVEPSQKATGHEAMSMAALEGLSAEPLARLARLLPAAIAAEIGFSINLVSECDTARRGTRSPARRIDRVMINVASRLFVNALNRDEATVRAGMRMIADACWLIASMEEPDRPASTWDIDATFTVHGQENTVQNRVHTASLDQAVCIAMIRIGFEWSIPFDRITIRSAVRHDVVGAERIGKTQSSALNALSRSIALP